MGIDKLSIRTLQGNQEIRAYPRSAGDSQRLRTPVTWGVKEKRASTLSWELMEVSMICWGSNGGRISAAQWGLPRREHPYSAVELKEQKHSRSTGILERGSYSRLMLGMVRESL